MIEQATTGQLDPRARLRDMWRPSGVDELEPAAWDALRYEGCAAVTAGPGAGKTEFLAQRAAYLLQTDTCASPRKILAISLKRDSAKNLARRVAERVPEHAERFVSMTFDAFSKGLLDRFSQILPDYWRPAGGVYELEFWNGSDAGDFLTEISGEVPSEFSWEFQGLNSWTFLANNVGRYSLPAEPPEEARSAEEYAVLEWWRRHYIEASTPRADFVMINRLAELAARSKPELIRAVRSTFPYVFVDEFQDTTSAQINFLETLFRCPESIVTAVGDSKQMIMGFAGAVHGAVDLFTHKFGAKLFQLQWNFRSSPALVTAQHGIAASLDADAAQVTSKATSESGHEPLTVWTFESETHQAEHIASWILNDIENSSRTTADFLLVARQKVADLEPALAAALGAKGLTLRNDDAQVGRMKLQDLLQHDVTNFLLGVLQLAVEETGQPQVWTQTLHFLQRLITVDESELSALAASDWLDRFTNSLSTWVHGVGMKWRTGAEIVGKLTSVVGEPTLNGFVRGTHTGDQLAVVLEAFKIRMDQALSQADGWHDLATKFRNDDAVTLMTIHRSKGLEFHTVLMLGLDDQQWWSIKKNPSEAISAFFVGFSRAGQRLLVTAYERSQKRDVDRLYGYLGEAGANVVAWKTSS